MVDQNDQPGTIKSASSPFLDKSLSLQQVSPYSAATLPSADCLKPIVSETGLISLSVDALGLQENTQGFVHVNKPAGATVRGAYLASADVWGSSGGFLPNGAVILNGQNVLWEKHAHSGGPNHAWANVTSIVAPVVNAAPTGIVEISLKETILLDGSILAVIFDDPNQLVSNTVVT